MRENNELYTGHRDSIFKSILILLALIFCAPVIMADSQVSTRAERRLIMSGNKLYREGRFAEALNDYKKALVESPSSDVAKFNLGLSCVSLAGKKEKGDSIVQTLMSDGVKYLSDVAALGAKKSDLSSKANYNLGNIRFEQEDYAGAIEFYKQALRLNPKFDDARRNLRIAQLRKQNQDQNQDKDQNKDQDQNQDQNKEEDKQDQDQNNQDQQDQNKDQQQDQDNSQQQPAENELSKQAAQQILNAVENNEARTRARKGNEQGKKAHGAGTNIRKW